jgi:hypothetical protein
MTVAKLIEHLKTFPGEMEIGIGYPHMGNNGISAFWELNESEVSRRTDNIRGDVILITSA